MIRNILKYTIGLIILIPFSVVEILIGLICILIEGKFNFEDLRDMWKYI